MLSLNKRGVDNAMILPGSVQLRPVGAVGLLTWSALRLHKASQKLPQSLMLQALARLAPDHQEEDYEMGIEVGCTNAGQLGISKGHIEGLQAWGAS